MSIATGISPLRQLFANKYDQASIRPYDLNLLLVAVALMSIGLVIVTSASMPAAARIFDNPFHFAIRHIIYICLALIAAFVTLQIPMRLWQWGNAWLLLGPFCYLFRYCLSAGLLMVVPAG